MLEEVEGTAGGKSGQAALDPGYHSKKNLEEAEKLKADCHMTARRGEKVGGMKSRGRWPRSG